MSMGKLELRAYSRDEIAAITGIPLVYSKGNANQAFIGRVREKLKRWGYSCETPPRGPVIITSMPPTAEEQLAEMMMRDLNLDCQTDTTNFACFIHFMLTEEGAESMPWLERESRINEIYGFDINPRTLSRYANRLIKQGAMIPPQPSQADQWWKTTIEGRKIQCPVPEDQQEEVKEYYRRRSEVVQEWKTALKCDQATTKEERKMLTNQAWSAAYKQMWSEFGCCYYRCKCLQFSGFGYQEIDRLLDLVTEIVEGVMEEHGKEVSAKSSKDIQTLYQSCCDENGEFVF